MFIFNPIKLLQKNYKEGVINKCPRDQSPNHAILIVGYGTDSAGMKYWIVKNRSVCVHCLVKLKGVVNRCMGIDTLPTQKTRILL